MAAWAPTRTVEDQRSLRDELLWEQKERLRRRLCILCGEHPSRCGCPEYETFDSRPLEGSDDPVYGV